MHHPITRLGQLESTQYIKYSIDGGRTWTFALVLKQPKQRRGGKPGYEVACEVRGKSTSHRFFFVTQEVLRDPNCIVQPATTRETSGMKFAGRDGKPRRQQPRQDGEAYPRMSNAGSKAV